MINNQRTHEKWEEFLENVTVEWLVENFITGRLGNHYPSHYIGTRVVDFIICLDGNPCLFTTPFHLLEYKLVYNTGLIDHLPRGVWKEFIRVMEL